jgi:TolB-like protein/DNA-binding winged helix-turn-helix (wHTH) protein/Tfp pilus assembly protein PilF
MPTSNNINGVNGLHHRYRFGQFVLDIDRGSLLKEGLDIPLRPKTFEMLCYLVRHQGVLVTRDQLQEAVWPQAIVSDESITQSLAEIRKALHDDSREMIRTVPRRGYLFDVPVTEDKPTQEPPGLESSGKGVVTDYSKPRAGLTSKNLIWGTLGLLVVVVTFLTIDRFVLESEQAPGSMESANQDGAKQVLYMDGKSVAVLPFANRSAHEDDEYFTDGMHDELLSRLSRLSDLKVISRTSVMRYKDTRMSIREIAEELGVGTILEGGVQRSGDQVRINVQLINANTDEHLWSEIYDRELTAQSLFAIQSEITSAIAQSLQATISPEEKDRVFELPTDNMEAYNHFLRGRQLFATRNKDDLEQAHVEFTRASELDPEFALAWVGLADTLSLLRNTGALGQDEYLVAHKQAVDKALAVNDQLGEAWVSLSTHFRDKGEREKAEAALLKGIELNPNYAQAYHWYAISITPRTRDAQARRLQLFYKASELDPRSSIVQQNLAVDLARMGKIDEGRQVLQRLLKWDPGFALAYQTLGNFDSHEGQLASAIQMYQKALELDPENGSLLVSLAHSNLALGDYDTLAEIREQMNETLAEDYESAQWLQYYTWVALSHWQVGLDFVAEMPEEERLNNEGVQWAAYKMHMFSGNFDKAREWMLKFETWITDRERWQQATTDIAFIPCEYVGVLIESGDEVLGRELLQFFMDYIEARTSAGNVDEIDLLRRARCYMFAGEIEQTMDLLGSEVAQGHLIDNWYDWSQEPWFSRLEDTPRYATILGTIHSVLAEQRALLKEMDASGSHIP